MGLGFRLGDRHLPKIKHTAKRSRIKAIFLGVIKSNLYLSLHTHRGAVLRFSGSSAYALSQAIAAK
jgi:hypothetical protein